MFVKSVLALQPNLGVIQEVARDAGYLTGDVARVAVRVDEGCEHLNPIWRETLVDAGQPETGVAAKKVGCPQKSGLLEQEGEGGSFCLLGFGATRVQTLMGWGRFPSMSWCRKPHGFLEMLLSMYESIVSLDNSPSHPGPERWEMGGCQDSRYPPEKPGQAAIWPGARALDLGCTVLYSPSQWFRVKMLTSAVPVLGRCQGADCSWIPGPQSFEFNFGLVTVRSAA